MQNKTVKEWHTEKPTAWSTVTAIRRNDYAIVGIICIQPNKDISFQISHMLPLMFIWDFGLAKIRLLPPLEKVTSFPMVDRRPKD